MTLITVTEAVLQSTSKLIDKPNTKAELDQSNFNSVLNEQINSSKDEQSSLKETSSITDNKSTDLKPNNLLDTESATLTELDKIETDINRLPTPSISSTEKTKNSSTKTELKELTNDAEQLSNSLETDITPDNLLANINMANQISHANKDNNVSENESESIATVSVMHQSPEANQETTTKDISSSKTSSETAVIIAENPVNLSITQAQPNNISFEPQIKTEVTNTSLLNNTPSTSYQINNGLQESGWKEAFNQRIIFMNHNNINSANITINPEHLGPIQVQLQIDAHQQTTIQFFAEHPEVRQSIQNSLPQLNSLFEKSGIQLGQTSVGSQQNYSENKKQSFSRSSNNNTSEKSDNNIGEVTTITRHGLINIYV